MEHRRINSPVWIAQEGRKGGIQKDSSDLLIFLCQYFRNDTRAAFAEHERTTARDKSGTPPTLFRYQGDVLFDLLGLALDDLREPTTTLRFYDVLHRFVAFGHTKQFDITQVGFCVTVLDA